MSGKSVAGIEARHSLMRGQSVNLLRANVPKINWTTLGVRRDDIPEAHRTPDNIKEIEKCFKVHNTEFRLLFRRDPQDRPTVADHIDTMNGWFNKPAKFYRMSNRNMVGLLR